MPRQYLVTKAKQKIPNKWRYEGILDIYSLFEEYVKKGLIKKGGLESALNNTTTNILRKEVLKLGYYKAFKKAELVKVLMTEGDIEELANKFIDNSTFVLTEAGKEELKENAYIFLPYYGLDEESANHIYHNFPELFNLNTEERREELESNYKKYIPYYSKYDALSCLERHGFNINMRDKELEKIKFIRPL